ncbi:MAG: hypothetical protein IPM79_37680 [Polyangiaceae bacterium]|nr:hypothetical protein [Polyangiaceae bacterium]MBK8943180.1 hypothetical protein [Polyangiaceae bacterium]
MQRSPNEVNVAREHPLVAAMQRHDDTVELLRVIQQEMARAAATLAFMAEHPEAFDLMEDGRAITREVRLMKRLAEVLIVERRKLGPPPLGPDHPQARRAFGLLVERVVEIARDVLPADNASALDARVRLSIAEDPKIPWP